MNYQLTTFVNILILLSMAIGAPALVISLLAIFNIKIKKEWKVYLYAFTAGLLIILGTVGFINEAIMHSKENFVNDLAGEHTHEALSVINTLQIIGVVAGGAIIGTTITILSRYIFTKIVHKKTNAGLEKGLCIHESHMSHNHNDFIFNESDIDNRKQKWLPVLLLCAHRLIDGIALGFMANTGTNTIAGFENWGMIIIFIVHLIPTTLVIYLIQLDVQNNRRWKALFISILLLFIMIPFTILGGFLINNIQSIWWLMPLFYSISGTLMTLGGILEVIPEFIHMRNAKISEWIWIVVWLSSAIILSIVLLLIHSH
ncbi:MAG: ZIP family metal transporter [Ureaplasma sp.]|nr:ZIP family metal transporter [Ureaplasma sp.]